MDALLTYLPEDRARALARGVALADRARGAALFADISGFTPLTEALTHVLGRRAGIETLTEQINTVYVALTAAVARQRGSVIGFAGDAITCWFDKADGPAAGHAPRRRSPPLGAPRHLGARDRRPRCLPHRVAAGRRPLPALRRHRL